MRPVFHRGDVVRLMSGSCDKTVVEIIEDGEGYNVAWDDDHGTPHEHYYPGEALELASEQFERKRREVEDRDRDARRANDAAGNAMMRRYLG